MAHVADQPLPLEGRACRLLIGGQEGSRAVVLDGRVSPLLDAAGLIAWRQAIDPTDWQLVLLNAHPSVDATPLSTALDVNVGPVFPLLLRMADDRRYEGLAVTARGRKARLELLRPTLEHSADDALTDTLFGGPRAKLSTQMLLDRLDSTLKGAWGGMGGAVSGPDRPI